MKYRYIEKNFTAPTLEIIDTAEDIINEYTEQGYVLTLRQLYYQFVARDLLANSQKSYNRLGSILNNARLAGLIDWEALEDRTRNLKELANWNTPNDLLHAAAQQFRFDKWENQPYRVEVWIEKDALVGVIEKVCDEHQVPYFACRGYSSQSEQWRAGQRFERYAEGTQQVVVFHLGDHDPSGIDMTRDNRERLEMFLGPFSDFLTVERLALNMDQVEEHNPPPNPAKFTDSRISGYIENFGDQSWELDALPPPVIASVVDDAILKYRDPDIWDEAVERENDVKLALHEVAVTFGENDDEG